MKKNLLKLFAVVLAVSLAMFSLTLTVFATDEDKLQITVGQATGYKNRDVDVTVSITNNPGILDLVLDVSYDSGLVLKSVTDGGILGVSVAEEKTEYGSSYRLAWMNDTQVDKNGNPIMDVNDFTATGTLVTLHFTIASAAAVGDHAVTVTCPSDDIDGCINTDMEIVDVVATNGKVTVNEATWVAGGKCADDSKLNWNLYNDSTLLIISGTGKMPNYKSGGSSASPWNKYASTITTVIVEDGCTQIGTWAFWNFKKLTDVTIAESVTAINQSAFYLCTTLPEITLPSNLITLGGYVFYSCGAMTEITIPSKVTTIGNNCFAYCDNLANIEMLGGTSFGNNVFFKCKSLARVILPSTMKTMGTFTFRACPKLTTVVFNEGLETIGDYCFYDCAGLKNIVLPSTIKTIGKYAFAHISGGSCNSTFVVIPEGFTSIGSAAFADNVCISEVYYNGTSETQATDWAKLSGVGGTVSGATPSLLVATGACGANATWSYYDNGTVIINGYGEMTDYASASAAPWASYAAQIKKVIVTGYVESIGTNAFAGCSLLSEINLASDFIDTIKANAFTNCAFTELTIPAKLTDVAANAFDALDTVYFEDTQDNMSAKNVFVTATTSKYATVVGTTGDAATWALYGTELVISGSGATGAYDSKNPAPWASYKTTVTKVTIKPGIVKLLSLAFSGFTTLTEVELPDSLKIIGASAFNGCTALNTINMPANLTTIQNYAFANCSALTSVALPEKVTSIDNRAFLSCTGLKSFTFNEKNVVMGIYVFSGCTALANVKLSSKMTALPERTFNGCKALTSIELPEILKTLGPNVFTGCSKLTKLVIPASVTSIGNNLIPGAVKTVVAKMTEAELTGALGSSTNDLLRGTSTTTVITAIAYGKETTNNEWIVYSNGDFVLSGTANMANYSKSKPAPWTDYVSSITNITVEDGVKTIGSYAFKACTNATTATIGNTVTSLGSGAFYLCSALTTIDLPASITTVNTYVFDSCSSLATINYAGTSAQWTTLLAAFNAKTGNTAVKTATVNCK